MNKFFIIVVFSIVTASCGLCPSGIKGQESECMTTVENWINSNEYVVSLDKGEYKAFSITIDVPNSLIAAGVEAVGGIIDFGVFDELSFYKWKSKEEPSCLACMKNVSAILCFVEVPKPGKYFLVFSNRVPFKHEVSYIFTTPPPVPINENKMLIIPESGFVAGMCSEGIMIALDFIVSESEPAWIVSYLDVPSKVLGLSIVEGSVNVSVEDEEGVTIASYQGLTGIKKINIGKKIATIEISTSDLANVIIGFD